VTKEEKSRHSAQVVRQHWVGKVPDSDLPGIEQEAYEYFLKENSR
jgi:hypothetical protein